MDELCAALADARGECPCFRLPRALLDSPLPARLNDGLPGTWSLFIDLKQNEDKQLGGAAYPRISGLGRRLWLTQRRDVWKRLRRLERGDATRGIPAGLIIRLPKVRYAWRVNLNLLLAWLGQLEGAEARRAAARNARLAAQAGDAIRARWKAARTQAGARLP
jgi:hypothetical protein